MSATRPYIIRAGGVPVAIADTISQADALRMYAATLDLSASVATPRECLQLARRIPVLDLASEDEPQSALFIAEAEADAPAEHAQEQAQATEPAPDPEPAATASQPAQTQGVHMCPASAAPCTFKAYCRSTDGPRCAVEHGRRVNPVCSKCGKPTAGLDCCD